ncbi:excalibur calcium-binding domain-containing protein [Shewanella chilikensis]|jgi:hypothetical protein|uniref:excalibur calcium-binding domain-containing protein n=1 Tax=Shewanella chilikensis TaxID=558541 RepID=UPI00384DF086
MKRFVFYLIFGYACYLSWVKLSGNEPQQLTDIHQNTLSKSIREAAQTSPRYASHSVEMDVRFHCDGRQYCSQMSSRAEAEYFNRYCPNTKMDGDNDGRPCENDSRW